MVRHSKAKKGLRRKIPPRRHTGGARRIPQKYEGKVGGRMCKSPLQAVSHGPEGILVYIETGDPLTRLQISVRRDGKFGDRPCGPIRSARRHTGDLLHEGFDHTPDSRQQERLGQTGLFSTLLDHSIQRAHSGWYAASNCLTIVSAHVASQ